MWKMTNEHLGDDRTENDWLFMPNPLLEASCSSQVLRKPPDATGATPTSVLCGAPHLCATHTHTQPHVFFPADSWTLCSELHSAHIRFPFPAMSSLSSCLVGAVFCLSTIQFRFPVSLPPVIDMAAVQVASF